MLQKIEEIKTYLYKYLEAQLNVLKTDTQERLERAVVQLIYLVVLLLLASLTSIFAFIMLAVLLNELLRSTYAGFAIMFGLLLMLTLLWIQAGKQVQAIVRKILYRVFRD
ncbi:MAG: phage holin family protein [Runella sp.]